MTHNIKDFVQLHKKLNGSHFGIILRNQDAISHILRRLLKLMANNSFEDVKGQLLWLSNFEKMAFKFEELKIWKESVRFASEVYALTKKFPRREEFGIISQLNRAAVSRQSKYCRRRRQKF